MTSYYDFGKLIKVRVTTKDIIDSKDKVEISWSAIGSVDANVAMTFLNDMNSAIKFARSQKIKLNIS